MMQALAPLWSFQTVQVSPLFGGRWDLTTVLDGAAAAGFRAVGLDVASVDRWIADGGREADLPSLLADRGLVCTDVVPISFKADRATTLAAARRLLDLAARCGARVCVTAVDTEWHDMTLGEVIDRMHVIAAMADDHGIRLAIEFLPYSPLTTVAEAAEVCAAVGWDRIGLVADTWQTCVGGQLDALATVPEGGIALVQLCDAHLPIAGPLREASRHHRALPGHGDLDMDRFVRTVVGRGFDGVVSTEVLADDLREMPPADAAAALLESAIRSWTPAS